MPVLPRLLAAAFFSLYLSTAYAADQTVECVQSILVRIGFDPGQPDGIIGKKTHSAVQSYVDELKTVDKELGPFVKSTGKFDKNTAKRWCDYLTGKHATANFFDRTISRVSKIGQDQIWQLQLDKGWKARIYGLEPAVSPKQFAFFVHGDDVDNSMLNQKCNRFGPRMPDSTVLVCIFRPYASNSHKRRQPEEVDEFTGIVRLFSLAWPNAKSHCLGHSGGGLLCLAAAQQTNVEFNCLVTTAPNSANMLWRKYMGFSINALHRRQYDPLDHVADTKAAAIMILGDKQDPKVDHRVWEAFINAAARHQIAVGFLETPGAGHYNQSLGMRELAACMKL